MEELVNICLGGRSYNVPKSIAKSIFNTILETPPIDYDENKEEVDKIVEKIKEAKTKGIY